MSKAVAAILKAVECRARRSRTALAIGFSEWKAPFVRNLLPDCEIISVDTTFALRIVRLVLQTIPIRCVIWSFKDEELGIPPDLLAGLEIERVEDGFVRSIGRGIDHAMPWSLCVDKMGLYYDATQPSWLEYLCNGFDRDAFKSVAHEAAAAMALLLSSGVTKYNGLGKVTEILAKPSGKESVLVLGQVEDDRSLTRNVNAISTNTGLLARARSDNPHATIYFKQHPDCIGERRRPGYVAVASDSGIVEIDHGTALPDAFVCADTVYTISSLGGFEALLRGKRVVTFGAPFYAGWGLTADHVSFPRRTRTLSLLELFYVAYMVYPIYLHPRTGKRLTLVEVIREMADATVGKS
jgi:capsular polysaccharide export protein